MTKDSRPVWANDGCDKGVWVLRSVGGDVWASVKPSQGTRGGYRVHWFGKGRTGQFHWMHGKTVFGLEYAIRFASVKAGFKMGEFIYPDLGIDWPQVHILEHTIGHWTGPTRHHPKPYRNVYAADVFTNEYACCMNLDATGLMVRHAGSDKIQEFGAELVYFSVTPNAYKVLNLEEPKP